MLTSSLSETRNQDQQRHRKGILRSGPPICPGIISFVERREKEMGKWERNGGDRTPSIVATGPLVLI